MVEAFSTTNGCTNSATVLHQQNWDKHVAKRIELRGQLDNVKATVEDPDFALKDSLGAIYKYRKGFGTGKYSPCYLLVIERPHLGGISLVSTYFTSHIRKDADILCLNRIAP